MSHSSCLARMLLLLGCLVASPACARRAGEPASAAPRPATATERAKSLTPRAPAEGVHADRLHAERIPVAFGDVRRLAATLETVLDANPRGSGPVRAVLIDERTGDLVVLGTDEGIARVRAILSPACDLPEDSAEEVEVLRLEHAAARSVVHAVVPLLGPGARVTADEPTNSILIQGVAADRARARRLIAALDAPGRS